MKKILFVNIIVFLMLLSIIPASCETILDANKYKIQSNFTKKIELSEGFINNYDEYPIMKVDIETLKKWEEDYSNAKKAYIDPKLEHEIKKTEEFSILDLVDYDPIERDQGRCSNCWAWPCTSILEIALYIQEDIFNRLSVQYINSCGYHVGVDCCEGGNINIFTNFYRWSDMAIPWSNENANFKDRLARCITDCESISTIPNYPISSIYTLTIETHEIPEDEAILNIKNILHQQKGIYFSWVLPDMDYRDDFSGDFWSHDNEDDIYDLDWACGNEYIEGEGGGHAVLLVGYNDEEGEENDYWIMLNSWGTTSRRPNGLFRVNMHMDYDCTYVYNEREYYSFDFETINVTFGSEEGAPNPPLIEGPINGSSETVYSYQISTIDPQGDDVSFMIDWGDNSTEGWIGPVSSGEKIQVNHSWLERGEYTISVKAKDINDDESLWSTLIVSMSKQKIFNKNDKITIWILDRFPFLQSYLSNMLISNDFSFLRDS
jgi:hypothetical protein